MAGWLAEQVDGLTAETDAPQGKRADAAPAPDAPAVDDTRTPAATPQDAAPGGELQPADAAHPRTLPDYVTLGQMAAIVKRSKRTAEKWKTRERDPLPTSDIEGGGGKPDEWDWPKVRPWLERETGRTLPERFPSLRPTV
jgi:hypothetical protein